MEVSDAVTALAAFVGSFLGQRHAAARLEPQLRALAERAKKLEGYAGIVRRFLSRVHGRVGRLERAQESAR